MCDSVPPPTAPTYLLEAILVHACCWPPTTRGVSHITTAGRRSRSRGSWPRRAAARPCPSAGRRCCCCSRRDACPRDAERRRGARCTCARGNARAAAAPPEQRPEAISADRSAQQGSPVPARADAPIAPGGALAAAGEAVAPAGEVWRKGTSATGPVSWLWSSLRSDGHRTRATRSTRWVRRASGALPPRAAAPGRGSAPATAIAADSRTVDAVEEFAEPLPKRKLGIRATSSSAPTRWHGAGRHAAAPAAVMGREPTPSGVKCQQGPGGLPLPPCPAMPRLLAPRRRRDGEAPGDQQAARHERGRNKGRRCGCRRRGGPRGAAGGAAADAADAPQRPTRGGACSESEAAAARRRTRRSDKAPG